MSTGSVCDMYLFIYNYFRFIFHISYAARKKSVLNSPWSTLGLCRITALETDGPDGSCSVRPSALHLSSLGLLTPCTHSSPLWFASAAPPPCVWQALTGYAGKRTPTVTMEAGQLRAGEWNEELSVQAQGATGVCTRRVLGSWKKPEKRRWVKHKSSVLHCFVNSDECL